MPIKHSLLLSGVQYVDYRYYAVLAGGASYTPPARTLGMIWVQRFGSGYMKLELYDGGAWIEIGESQRCPLAQDDAQSLRITNNSGSGYKISPQGVTWSLAPPFAVFSNYHYYAALAALANYTPPIRMLGILMAEFILGKNVHVQIYDGGAWVTPTSVQYNIADIAQDEGQNMRVLNPEAATVIKITLQSTTWSS